MFRKNILHFIRFPVKKKLNLDVSVVFESILESYFWEIVNRNYLIKSKIFSQFNILPELEI